jgi:hypothetical protein
MLASAKKLPGVPPICVVLGEQPSRGANGMSVCVLEGALLPLQKMARGSKKKIKGS